MLDSRFLIENLPFFPAAPLRRPPSSVKPRPGVRKRSSRLWRVSSFHFLSLHRLGVTAQILWSSFLAPSPEARDTVSFGLEYILYTVASEPEDFGAASLDVLPPSDQEVRPSPAHTELVDVLAHATEKLRLDWPDEPRESQSSKLDERFLSGSGLRPMKRKLPLFPDLHHEVSRSWKQPFSSRLTNAAAAVFTNLVGSVEQGYGAVKDTLGVHLSPTSAPSWKSRPLLPSKSCITTSALIAKSYMATGQAGAAIHTMAILQAYQAEVLKETDEGDGVTPEAVKELRRATDLPFVLLSIQRGRFGAVWQVWWWLSATCAWTWQRSGKRRRLSSSTPRSPALAYSATRLTLLSISSGLHKHSQLRSSSSCHYMRANRPLPHPPVSAQPPKRRQSVEGAIRYIPHRTRSREPVVVPLLAKAPASG